MLYSTVRTSTFSTIPQASKDILLPDTFGLCVRFLNMAPTSPPITRTLSLAPSLCYTSAPPPFALDQGGSLNSDTLLLTRVVTGWSARRGSRHVEQQANHILDESEGDLDPGGKKG